MNPLIQNFKRKILYTFFISKVNRAGWYLYPSYGEERLYLIGDKPLQNH